MKFQTNFLLFLRWTSKTLTMLERQEMREFEIQIELLTSFFFMNKRGSEREWCVRERRGETYLTLSTFESYLPRLVNPL